MRAESRETLQAQRRPRSCRGHAYASQSCGPRKHFLLYDLPDETFWFLEELYRRGRRKVNIWITFLLLSRPLYLRSTLLIRTAPSPDSVTLTSAARLSPFPMYVYRSYIEQAAKVQSHPKMQIADAQEVAPSTDAVRMQAEASQMMPRANSSLNQ